jgi:ADP-ribose pyrophosphatase
VTGFRHLGDSAVLHDGKVWWAVTASFEAPDGTTFEREIVRTRGAVAVVAISYADDDAAKRLPYVTLIDQYRGALDRLVLELPAGMRDVEGEPATETARRELIEEVGLDSARLESLMTIATSPGVLDERLEIFVAHECVSVERAPAGPEERFSTVRRLPLAETLSMIDDGRIENSTAICGLSTAARRLGVC